MLLALVAVAIALAGRTANSDDPTAGAQPSTSGTARSELPLPAIPAPDAESSDCEQLLAALPDELTSAGSTMDRQTLAAPTPPGAAAWRRKTGGQADDQPVVLRCGVERPAELTRTSPLLDVSGVRWLQLTGDGASTWVAVDRPVYVALTFTDGTGTGPVQDVSAAIEAVLPAQRVPATR